MFKPRKGITVEDFMRELERDPDFARRKAERETELVRLEAKSRKEQAMLLRELAAVDVRVSTVWDLVNTADS